ncbi:hypothetical protein LTR10_003757 [Elasticomyces elasticus]|nr:hypothetical protein LTR10_003757 [Elasticomyces elasticus]KAK4978052.1 hypothetical protein LTR42_002427 [Elasticomyces elasticus]
MADNKDVKFLETALARFSNAPARLLEPPFYTGHGLVQPTSSTSIPASIGTYGASQIEDFLKNEMGHFDSTKANGAEESWYFDNYGGVFNQKLANRDRQECIRRCVSGLGTRFRVQALFWMAATDLVKSGSLDTTFREPGYFDWYTPDSTRTVRRVERILTTLRVPAALNAAMASSGEPVVLGVPFSSPTKWLAIIVARYAITFEDIISRLLQGPYLGPFLDNGDLVKAELKDVLADDTPLDDFGNVKVLAATQKLVPAVGFWLEDATSSDRVARQEVKARYRRLQQAENILGWDKDPSRRSDAFMMDFLDQVHG